MDEIISGAHEIGIRTATRLLDPDSPNVSEFTLFLETGTPLTDAQRFEVMERIAWKLAGYSEPESLPYLEGAEMQLKMKGGQ